MNNIGNSGIKPAKTITSQTIVTMSVKCINVQTRLFLAFTLNHEVSYATRFLF